MISVFIIVPSLTMKSVRFMEVEMVTLHWFAGNQLSFLKAGQANIVAVAIGDVNVAQSNVISRPLVVDKPVITITADDKSRLVNTANPTFTYTATGFVNGENTSVFTTAPTLTPKDGSGATIPNNSNTAGTFSIVPSGAAAANYNFNYVNGIFIVDARTEQTISWTGSEFCRIWR